MSKVLDKRTLEARVRRLIEGRQYHEALDELWAFADRANIGEDEFRFALREMASVYLALGRVRAAASVRLYLGDVQGAVELSSSPLDRARVEAHVGNWKAAAQSFERAGWLGHAAIQLERAGVDAGARVLWERLSNDPRLRADPYTCGLVHFNLGRACLRLGDRTAGRRAIIHAMHLLTAAADGFEASGQRERAFDCFGVLLTIGREGSFENLAEGYLNCIRILREDGLKYYVLQYYEDFQSLAMQRGELQAAATLYREAADYARRQGLAYGRYYRSKGAEASALHGDRLASVGATELAENAYAAAIDGYSEVGQFSKVRALYEKLAGLDLGEARKKRYARLAQRVAGLADDPPPSGGFPDSLRMQTAYPEVWILDVVEWEQNGDPAETMIDVALDRSAAEPQRRRAMLCRLAQLGAGEQDLEPVSLARLAALLGSVELYVCLAPLERMMEHDDSRVRVAVMRAMRRLFYKRSFVTVIRGLSDSAPDVRREAVACVAALHFVHALDPLSRIYRSSSDAEVRRAALASIGRVHRVEAVEILLDVLRNGDRSERDLARELLSRSELAETSAILRREIVLETGPVREVLERILRSRGG